MKKVKFLNLALFIHDRQNCLCEISVLNTYNNLFEINNLITTSNFIFSYNKILLSFRNKLSIPENKVPSIRK